MADLFVDLDGLRSLEATIRDIQSTLNNTGSTVDDAKPSMGSGTVCDALDHFEDHWSDGRKHINTNADTMAAMLSQSVDAYTKTDTDLSTGLQSSTTETRVGGGHGHLAAE